MIEKSGIRFAFIVTLLCLNAGGQDALATTYNEIMSRATTEEKPAQLKNENEHPVLVSYEVGDTSGFFADRGRTEYFEEESEWGDWEEENY